LNKTIENLQSQINQLKHQNQVYSEDNYTLRLENSLYLQENLRLQQIKNRSEEEEHAENFLNL
jgi:regulator of replication initiation timing